ncbi:MAG: DMT family transporter [Cyanobacteria bacterium P01_F01_bin.56]
MPSTEKVDIQGSTDDSVVTKLSRSPLFLIAPFFFLGTAMVAMKYILPHTSPFFLAAFRLLPAGVLILILAVILKLPQPKTLTAWLWIGLFALVDGALFQGLLTAGLVNTGAGIGAVLIDAQPLVVALLARFFFGDKIGFWGAIGLAIGIAGICLCGLPEERLYALLNEGIPLGNMASNVDGFSWSALANSGELLMLLSALSMSFGTIIVGYVKRYADPIVATGWHMLLGGAPLLAFSLLWESNQVDNLLVGDWVGLLYATVFGTALTYGMFFFLAANGNMTSVSALIFLTPVFALLFSSLFLGEQLTQLQWAGVSLTLVSVYLVNQRQQIAQTTTKFLERFGGKVRDGQVPLAETDSGINLNPADEGSTQE